VNTDIAIADSHDTIQVRGARENNLRDISLDLPKRRLTVFTGVSGSGKSSLVFGTIAAESQRLINETYSAFVQGFMPSLGRPDVDSLQNLSAAIIVDQERMGANSRSTVGTATDVNAMLRIVFSRLGEPHIGPSFYFGFNAPEGMCPHCEGLGQVSDIDLDQLFDRTKSLAEGAITIPGYNVDGWMVRGFTESGFVPADVPIQDFTEQQTHDFLYKEPVKVAMSGFNMTYEGLVPKVRKSILSKDKDSVQPHIRAFIDRAVAFQTCPECDGTPAERRGPLVAHRGQEHRGLLPHADQRPRRLRPRDHRPAGRAAHRAAAADPRLPRRDRSRVPEPRSHLRFALRRGGAARQDGAPPGLAAHGCQLHLRRAHDRAAPARHPADERAPAPTPGQGKHRPGSSSTSPRRSSSPTTSSISAHVRASTGAPSSTRVRWRACARATASPVVTSATGHPSRMRCASTRARSRSAARRGTTSRTSTSTSRSEC
jgi:energy-coupling factor transporter ATP-binding protein EcfA2